MTSINFKVIDLTQPGFENCEVQIRTSGCAGHASCGGGVVEKTVAQVVEIRTVLEELVQCGGRNKWDDPADMSPTSQVLSVHTDQRNRISAPLVPGVRKHNSLIAR